MLPWFEYLYQTKIKEGSHVELVIVIILQVAAPYVIFLDVLESANMKIKTRMCVEVGTLSLGLLWLKRFCDVSHWRRCNFHVLLTALFGTVDRNFVEAISLVLCFFLIPFLACVCVCLLEMVSGMKFMYCAWSNIKIVGLGVICVALYTMCSDSCSMVPLAISTDDVCQW